MKLTLAAAALALAPMTASAAVLDFGELTFGTWQGSNTAALSNATITTSGADIFAGASPTYANGPNGGFCGVTSISGGNCSTSTTIDFSDLIADLSFNMFQYGFGDVVVASIFAGGSLLNTQTFTSEAAASFAGFSGVTSIVLDASASTSAGLVYGDFTFDVATVPVPASLPLLLVGLGGIVALRRRKTAA